MKKILLLLALVSGLWACSTDEDDLAQSDNTILLSTSGEVTSLTTSCFNDLTGSVRVDVSGGFTNPIVIFTPVVSGTVSSKLRFRARLEVQPLANCDDMNSNSGPILNFPYSYIITGAQSSPSISVRSADLPICYKWRFVFEGISSSTIGPSCSSASVWYESPLF